MPFSTSNTKQAILNYYDNDKDGLLLKLKGDLSGYSTFFPCHFLSDFVNEYEQFWIGGNWPMIYKNVTSMSSGYNLKIYLYALYVIKEMFDGVYFEINKQGINQDSWKSLQEVVIKLLNHRLYKVNSDETEENDDEKKKEDKGSSDDDEEEEDFIDEEEIAARQRKQMSIARRPSARNFKRSSFKPPTRALPQLPANLQKKQDPKKDDDDDDKKEDKDKKKKKVNKYKKFKEIPKYIDILLKDFCKSQKEVRVDYMRMNKEKSKSMPNYRGYKFCGDLFCLYKIEWIKLPIILQLFPNLEQIEIWGQIELNTKIFDYILVILVTQINNLIKENDGIKKDEAMKLLKLKSIKIDEPDEEVISIKKIIKKYSKKFNKIGWKMYVEEDDEETQLIMEYDKGDEDEDEDEDDDNAPDEEESEYEDESD